MTAHFNPEDLTTIADEPLVLDELLAMKLAFERPRTIRQLIERNLPELEGYGGVCCMAQQTSSKGGRPGKEYYLNEAQALLICMFSHTPKAVEVRKALIEVYQAWRASHRTPEPPKLPPPAAPAARTAEPAPEAIALTGATLRDRLAVAVEIRHLHGAAVARALWPSLGLPVLRPQETTPAGEASPDAIACLRHVLSEGTTVFLEERRMETRYDVLCRALDGEVEDEASLAMDGFRIEEGDEQMVWIATYAANLRRAYDDTPWRDRWREVLRTLPGTMPAGNHKVRGGQSRGTLVPERYIHLARPEPGQAWV